MSTGRRRIGTATLEECPVGRVEFDTDTGDRVLVLRGSELSAPKGSGNRQVRFLAIPLDLLQELEGLDIDTVEIRFARPKLVVQGRLSLWSDARREGRIVGAEEPAASVELDELEGGADMAQRLNRTTRTT